MITKEQDYILALYQCQSITKASELLHITQPALSIFLGNLEKRIGLPLFERVGKKLVPTPAGDIYIQRALQIVEARSNFEKEIADVKLGLRGTLRIGSLRRKSLHLMPKIIRIFSEKYPSVDVVLTEASPERLERMLQNGDIDLVYLNTPINAPNITSIELGQDYFLIALSPGHPAAQFAQILSPDKSPYLDLKYMKNETFFLLDNMRAVNKIANLAFEYAGFHPANVKKVSSIDLGCQFAAEGLGVSFSMDSYRKSFIYYKPLDFFWTGDPNIKIKWKIYKREQTFTPAYMDYFIHLLCTIEP